MHSFWVQILKPPLFPSLIWVLPDAELGVLVDLLFLEYGTMGRDSGQGSRGLALRLLHHML